MPTVTQGRTAAFDCIEPAPDPHHSDQLDERIAQTTRTHLRPLGAPIVNLSHPTIACQLPAVGSSMGGQVRTRSLPIPQRVVTIRGEITPVVPYVDPDPVTSSGGIDAVTPGDGKDMSWL